MHKLLFLGQIGCLFSEFSLTFLFLSSSSPVLFLFFFLVVANVLFKKIHLFLKDCHKEKGGNKV